MSTLISKNHSGWMVKAPQLALILITIIWGGSFITVQYGLNFSSPIMFVGLRFAAAALAVTLISLKSLKGMNLKEVFAGAVIGVMIAIGYGTQTVGLQTISSSESAFLTALYVPLVPILLWLLFRKKPHVMTWIGALFAFIGLVFLTGNGFAAIQLSFGQTLTLLGSIAIALEIIFISYFAEQVNVRRVTVLQLIFASLFCFMIAPVLGEISVTWISLASGRNFSRFRHCQCLDPTGDELGSAHGGSFASSDYLCRRTGMGSPVWPSGRRTFTVTGFIRRIAGGTGRDCQ